MQHDNLHPYIPNLVAAQVKQCAGKFVSRSRQNQKLAGNHQVDTIYISIIIAGGRKVIKCKIGVRIRQSRKEKKKRDK